MKMKIPKLISRKKLRATVARRSLRASAETYDDLLEPNMKLSRALLIVLVLHVVAVSGIVAFNAIKTRQDSYVKTAAPNVAATPALGAESASDKAEPADASHSANSTASISQVSRHSLERASSKDEHKSNRAKPSEHASIDSRKTYVVAKGDSPVTIAKKLKVSYDDLIALNHIDDPRKLQIGQKLLIPKTAKAKKTDE